MPSDLVVLSPAERAMEFRIATYSPFAAAISMVMKEPGFAARKRGTSERSAAGPMTSRCAWSR
jgi:hypothetical protein